MTFNLPGYVSISINVHIPQKKTKTLVETETFHYPSLNCLQTPVKWFYFKVGMLQECFYLCVFMVSLKHLYTCL
jgi:hypothetical protein